MQVGAINQVIDVLAEDLRKSDRMLTLEGTKAAAFAALPAPLREVLKCSERCNPPPSSRAAPIAVFKILVRV
jgi:hypothetical protein